MKKALLIPALLIVLSLTSCQGATEESFSGTPISSKSEESTEPYSFSEDPIVLEDDQVLVVLGSNFNNQRPDYKLVFHFGDDVFPESALTYSKDLSYLSFGSSACNGDRNQLHDFYTRIGFNNFYACEAYNYEPTKDTMGYFFAHKTIGDYEMISVSLRGFNYGAEWASNFLMGATGNHQGFDDKANEVLASLKDYINDFYAESPVKLWITGYSRGGAVANVLASKIMQDTSLEILPKDTYVYTFEAPQGLTEENAEHYENVFNIVDACDIVPKVAPQAYGLYRCGTDILVYPQNFEEVIKDFDRGIAIPKFGRKTGYYDTEDQFADYILGQILEQEDNDAVSLHTRELFANNYQETILFMFDFILSLDSATQNDLMNALSKNIAKLVGNENNLYNKVVKPVLDEHNVQYEEEPLKTHCRIIQTLALKKLSTIMQVADDNGNRMLMHHYPEINYALLKYYNDNH